MAVTIREQLEEREVEYLSPYATLSRNSRGRQREGRSAISVRYFRGTGTGFCTARHFAG